MRPTVRRLLGFVLPLVGLVGVAVALLRGADVPWESIGTFGLYALGALTLPGVVALRLVTPRFTQTWLEDLTFGSLFGYCLQIPVYLVGVAVGLPLLPAATPVLLLVVGLSSRRARRLVLAPRRLDPPWLVLGLATLAAYLLAWVARYAWTLSPLTVAGRSSPYVDRPYHVALVTELRHHFPPELSFVDGQPLHYHWFVHAHIAATSWLTGIDTMVLLTRLWMVPVLALTVFGTGLLTVRLTGHPWTGVAASALLVLVGDFDPFGWSRTANFVDERFLTPVIDLSPTHTFATALLLLVVGLMCAALTDGARSPGTWVALTVSMLGLSGAKATFVPMLLAGCLAVIGLRVLRRTWSPRAGGLLLVTLAVLAFAQLVIFGAESQGMAADPGHLARAAASHAGLGPTTAGTLLTVGAALVAWLVVPGAGVVGLLVSGRWRDDRAVLLAGIVVSGVLAAMTFGHSHYGEAYFARSTAVPTAVLSAWGLGLLVGYADRRRWGVLCGAVVAGAVVLGVVESLTGRVPGTGSGGVAHPFQHLVLPYVAVAAGVAAVVALLAVATRRRPGMAGIVPAAAVLCVLGLSLSRQVHVVEEMTQPPDPFVPPHARAVMVGPGGFGAAAWLRDHSAVDDLVATNAHQRTPRGGDNRAFWIAAESERHVLVEGWGYSPPVLSGSRATGVSDTHAGFWDPALLAENDAAFTDPSTATVTRLARAEGVRWLFVDARFPSRPRAMGEVADLRFRSGDYWIFEVRGA